MKWDIRFQKIHLFDSIYTVLKRAKTVSGLRTKPYTMLSIYSM